MPKISLLVVIKGPVAIAGSIPLLSKKRGINVPIIPATIITITSEIEIARATKYSSPENMINKNKITDKINPLRIDKKVSLISLLFTLPLMSSLARP